MMATLSLAPAGVLFSINAGVLHKATMTLTLGGSESHLWWNSSMTLAISAGWRTEMIVSESSGGEGARWVLRLPDTCCTFQKGYLRASFLFEEACRAQTEEKPQWKNS